RGGYNKEGYDEDGYNRRGYDKEGYDKNGCTKNNQCRGHSDFTSDESEVLNTPENIGKEFPYSVVDSQKEISFYYNCSNDLV
ncbi:hypothetical protein, partial [Wolbachia pipientis]|uniref:hypothetical protein n=3 Tax=Wolbachieae TaxID=952 RepID=UPI0005878247